MAMETSGPHVILTITNTGSAIPADEQPRVFERFYRGSNVMAEGIEGTGLGLSIAHWIATAHHGALTFTSEPDRTSFTFRLATQSIAGQFA
jgi:signal transduction histidine kinase